MKAAQVVVKTRTLRVSITSLDPREIADWHYQTQITDGFSCPTGMIIFRKIEPDEKY